MTRYETVAFAYCCLLAVASCGARVALRRRVAAFAIAVGVAVVAITADRAVTQAFRPWLAHGYLLVGYWLPALLVSEPDHSRFEHWLQRTDAAIRRRLPAVPRKLTHLTELAYLFCYPLVPLAFLVVWIEGTDADVQRFWTSVLLAGYACYVTLPWLVSRPPRLRQPAAAAPYSWLAALNKELLDRVSHRLTTFPSGHVAVAAAAAAMVAPVSPSAAASLAVVVVLISVGAAAGGYHYVVDVIAGLGVATASTALAVAVL